MTKRLYYTCPIKALYMMKEFGVQFQNEEGDNIHTYEEFKRASEINVVEKSEEIFEPRKYDIGLDKSSDEDFYLRKESKGVGRMINFWENVANTTVWGIDKDINIIRREDEHFLQPEIENND